METITCRYCGLEYSEREYSVHFKWCKRNVIEVKDKKIDYQLIADLLYSKVRHVEEYQELDAIVNGIHVYVDINPIGYYSQYVIGEFNGIVTLGECFNITEVNVISSIAYTNGSEVIDFDYDKLIKLIEKKVE